MKVRDAETLRLILEEAGQNPDEEADLANLGFKPVRAWQLEDLVVVETVNGPRRHVAV